MTLRKAGCLVTSPTRCPSIHRSGGRARKPSMYSAPVRAAIPFASWWPESVEARTDVLLGLSVLPSGRLADDDAQLGPDRVAGRGLPDPVQCQWAEVQLGFVRVMRAAAQLDVVDCRCATCRMRLHVVELQEAGRGAAAPRRPPERAPPPVPEPDGPRGTVRGGIFLPGEFFHQPGQTPGKNLIQIAVGNLVAQQVLRQPQFLARLCTRGELDLIVLRRQRGHHRWPCT